MRPDAMIRAPGQTLRMQESQTRSYSSRVRSDAVQPDSSPRQVLAGELDLDVADGADHVERLAVTQKIYLGRCHSGHRPLRSPPLRRIRWSAAVSPR
jgi:hypothetical protein